MGSSAQQRSVPSESSLGDLHNEWKYIFFCTKGVQTQLLVKNKINKIAFLKTRAFSLRKHDYFCGTLQKNQLSFYKVDYIQTETRVP